MNRHAIPWHALQRMFHMISIELLSLPQTDHRHIFIRHFYVFSSVSKTLYRICRNKRPPQTAIFQRGEYIKPMGFDGWFFQRGEYTKPMGFDGWFFKGGGGVHKTNGFWWVIFQRGGEYIKPMGSDEWFFKGGSTQNRWLLECLFIASKN